MIKMKCWLSLLLDGVGDEQAGVLLLIQQHHGSQISHTLLAVARAGNHPNTLHLVGRATTPLNVKLFEILTLLMPKGNFLLIARSKRRSGSASEQQPWSWAGFSGPVLLICECDAADFA